jgi:hypothetical protein
MFGRRSDLSIAAGLSFKSTGAKWLDMPAIIWTVEGVYARSDGREHALLVSQSDRTMHKTVSVDALRDARLFRPELR